MAYSSFLFLFFCSLLFISSTLAQTPIRPKALILPVTKDSSTLQYLTQIKQRTPPVPVTLTLDLGGQFLWVDCDQGYTTSTYRPARCESAQCSLANANNCMTECYSAPRPGCTNNTCVLLPSNSEAHTAASGTVGSDVVSIHSASDSTSISVPQFIFVCGSTFLLDNLASGVKGMAGLGRTKISLPSQFASSFSLNRKFAICLSSTPSNGNVFFGDVDSSTAALTHTPLLINPISTASAYSEGDASAEYFIGVKSIKINNKSVNIDYSKLLSINTTDGTGGTKISTVDPYTVLHTKIFKAVVKTFVKELNVTRVASVAPFGACFNAKEISTAYTGPAVPVIDLVLQNKNVCWRIFGWNSMVKVSKEVLCLGFVDGGKNPTTSIVIGGHQIEENLLEFDLASSNLGFSSLVYRKQVCANFNFAGLEADA